MMTRLYRHTSGVWIPLAMFIAAALLAVGCPAPREPDAAPTRVPADRMASNGKTTEGASDQPGDSITEPIQPDKPGTEGNESLDSDAVSSPQNEQGKEPGGPILPSDEQVAAGGYGAGADTIDFESINGKLFEGWGKPQAALVFSGMQQGFIEPCGCAGLEKKMGGVSRRHTLLKQLQQQDWPIAPLEVGGLVRRLGTQAELKYAATTDALQEMVYEVVGLDADDLRLPTEALIATIKPGAKTHFVSANVGFFDFESGLTAPFKVVEVGDKKFGVTTVLSETQRNKIHNDEIVTQPAADALPPVIEKMKAAGADQLILLVSGEPEEAKALAKQFSEFDFVVSPGPTEPPPMSTQAIDGTETKFIELSHKGMYVGVLGFFDDEQQPIRYQRVPLDGRFDESPEIRQVMVNYQDQLKALGWDGLGIKPLPDPGGHEFIGSQTCADCHTSAHSVWSDTTHGHALKTLEKLDPPRHFDAECVSCHVVGWEPKKYVPYVSGFRSREETPELVHQGCENCHGGGREHALIELGEIDADKAKQDAARLAMRVSLATEEGKAKVINNCMQCHDLDNSPDFDFDTYWPAVEHKGLD